MKRLIAVIIAVVAVTFSLSAKSFCSFGLSGGIGTPTYYTSEEIKSFNPSSWNAGIALKFDLPLFFVIQPEVKFEQTLVKENVEKLSNVIIPIAVQWGPDLGVIRPFVQVVPFLAYNINSYNSGAVADWNAFKVAFGQEFAKCQYGVGLGAGLDIWKVQLNFRYNLGVGTWDDVKNSHWKDYEDGVKQKNFNSMTFGVSYFF